MSFVHRCENCWIETQVDGFEAATWNYVYCEHCGRECCDVCINGHEDSCTLHVDCDCQESS